MHLSDRRVSAGGFLPGSSSARTHFMFFANDSVEPFLGSFVTRKTLLFGSESGCVITAAAVDHARGMFDVQHLVEEDVFDKPFRYVTRIERLADRDGIVRCIVMAEDAARASLRPSQHRFGNLTLEIASIDTSKNSIQVIHLSLSARDYFSASLLAGNIRRAQDLRAEGVGAINAFVIRGSFSRQQSRDQQKRQRTNYLRGCALKDIRQAHIDASGTHSNRVMQPGIRIESYFDVRRL